MGVIAKRAWRERIEGAIRRERSDLQSVSAVVTGESVFRGSHPADHDVRGTHTANHVTRYSPGKIAALQRNLMRLDQGGFGICIGCGSDIPMARMEALPEAERCLDCQAASEVRVRSLRR